MNEPQTTDPGADQSVLAADTAALMEGQALPVDDVPVNVAPVDEATTTPTVLETANESGPADAAEATIAEPAPAPPRIRVNINPIEHEAVEAVASFIVAAIRGSAQDGQVPEVEINDETLAAHGLTIEELVEELRSLE